MIRHLAVLSDLFSDDPTRVDRFTMEVAGLWFDWSKTHLTAAHITAGITRLDQLNFPAWRDRLINGDLVNETEGQAAEHLAERGTGALHSLAMAKAYHEKMAALADKVDSGHFGVIRHVIHVGIGGSGLGPQLLIDALGRGSAAYDVHIISNVDGCALQAAFAVCDPDHTLLVIASKTFTTSETMVNARSVIHWLERAGIANAWCRIIAVTAAPDKAVEWGVHPDHILPFSQTVGGRYSLWSSIGFPAALALGLPTFRELLRGAQAMDLHFIGASPHENAPVIAALVDRYYVEQAGCQTRAVFAYDERLRYLPHYLQQLEMESNGKSVDKQGKALRTPSAPITWGGVGTDAQHAVFQLLHQGSVTVPVEFLAVILPDHGLDERHHTLLLANCLAQGAALMKGRPHPDAARSYEGNRPSTTILLDQLTPHTLGALISFYEHRTFVNSILIGCNPFDQFGVELGKEIARELTMNGSIEMDPSTAALARRMGWQQGKASKPVS